MPSAAASRHSRVVAITGVGETDYGLDFAAARGRAGDRRPPDPATLLRTAFARALDDAGLRADQVDGLITCVDDPTEGVPQIAATLGIAPRFAANGDTITPLGMAGMKGVVPTAVESLVDERCNTLAVLYSARPRTTRKQFGGTTYVGDSRHSYYYHHPWGWSSQAAHWAIMFTHYQQTYGATESDLARVAISLRSAAERNPNAIMRTPLTVEAYLAAPYVVRPLRRLDLCLPNDGAVCLVLQRVEDAGNAPQQPVVIAGWADEEVTEQKIRSIVADRLATQMRVAGESALEMAGLSLGDVGHFQGYDASTFHLVDQVEGYGFAKPGTGLQLWADGHFDLGGALPVNTSGGMLSEAYMHGWNFFVEATRQLRGQCGPRQIPGLSASMLAITTTESAHPLVLTRGGAR